MPLSFMALFLPMWISGNLPFFLIKIVMAKPIKAIPIRIATMINTFKIIFFMRIDIIFIAKIGDKNKED